MDGTSYKNNSVFIVFEMFYDDLDSKNLEILVWLLFVIIWEFPNVRRLIRLF